MGKLESKGNIIVKGEEMPIKKCKGKINMNNKCSKYLKLYHIIHKCKYIAERTKSIRILKKEKKRIHIIIRKMRKLYIA